MTTWDDACLANLATDGELRAFDTDGYVMVPGALTPAQVERLRDVADRADAAFRSSAGVGPYHVLNEHDLI